jgi:WbqC-like protein family
MKKVAIMQPYFLPYIGYFQLINAVDEFILYDDVSFINKGYINRNNILVNNKANLFSIPLKEASQNKLICEIEIIQDEKWQSKLLKTIAQSYKKAPYFNDIFPIFMKIIHFEIANLSKYIHNSIVEICNYIGINTEIIASSTIYNNQELKAQLRILDICKKVKAQNYINPIGGLELYEKVFFEMENINLNFIKTKQIEYEQFGSDFVPNLSILDVLMFNSKAEIVEILNKYDLK